MAGKKGDLEFIINSDPNPAVQAMAKVIAKQEQSIDKLKNANRESKKTQKGFEEMGSPLGKIVGDVGKIATGFLSAQGAAALFRKAIQLVSAEIDDLKRKQAEAGRAQLTFDKDFSRTIGLSFGMEGIGKLDQYREQVKKDAAGDKFLSETTITQMIDAYKSSRPGATWEDTRAAYRYGAKAFGFENRPELVKLVGEVQESFPEISTDDAYDIAYTMRADAGKRADQLSGSYKGVQQLKAMGIDPMTALGINAAAVEVELGNRALSTYSGVLGKTKISGKDQTAQMLQNMTPAQRHDWIVSNPELAPEYFGDTIIPLMPLFQKGLIESKTQRLQEAAAGDYYTRTASEYGQQKTGAFVTADEKMTNLLDQMSRDDLNEAMSGFVRESLKKFLEKSDISKLQRGFLEKQVEVFSGFGTGDYVGQAQQVLEQAKKQYGEDAIYYSPTGGYGPGKFETAPNPNYNPQMLEYLSTMVEILRQLDEQMKRQTQSTDAFARIADNWMNARPIMPAMPMYD